MVSMQFKFLNNIIVSCFLILAMSSVRVMTTALVIMIMMILTAITM